MGLVFVYFFNFLSLEEFKEWGYIFYWVKNGIKGIILSVLMF